MEQASTNNVARNVDEWKKLKYAPELWNGFEDW